MYENTYECRKEEEVEEEMKEINIVSFGAGQNSTAMIIMMKNEGIKIDEIIYSETGNEMPKTYIFLKEFKQWCKKNDLKFVTVQSKLGSLKDYYVSRNIIPYRMFRQCTHKFKIIPINDYIKKEYGIKVPINMIMGIASDEKHRSKKIKGRKQFTYKFPLIEKEIDRKGCVDIIKKEGLSIPVKSGCYFCPFQSKKEWIKLYENYPDLFDETILFEKNGRAYPEGNLIGNITLEDFRRALKEQTRLDFTEDVAITKCAYCHT